MKYQAFKLSCFLFQIRQLIIFFVIFSAQFDTSNKHSIIFMKKLVLIILLFPVFIYSQIKFDANFESGNLDTVTTTDSIHYSVTTREDIGGRWFYFRITGVKNKFISVIIINSDVDRPMYSYDNKTFVRFTESESPQIDLFQKTFTRDTVYVSYYTPYTFSYLQKRIAQWKQYPFVKVDTMGLTPMGLPMQEIIITDPNTPDSGKYQVWIHARTHPGETPGSFHFDGIVQELLKDNPVIKFYREKIVYHLIPFVNPDGVYYGRSRTNFDGVDLEANWDKPADQTSQEVKILKKRMSQINAKKVISVFVNIHSIASSSCTVYIHTPNSTSQRFYQREYEFANLQSSDNPYFSQSDYNVTTLRSKFPEGWLWNNYGNKVMAMTYETPYDHYSDGTWVTNKNLYRIGARTVYAISEFLQISHPEHLILDNKNAITDGPWALDSAGVEFFGDNYYKINPGSGNNKVIFQSQPLSPGIYDISGWWPSDKSFSYNTNIKINFGGYSWKTQKTEQTNGGQWNYLTQITSGFYTPFTVTVDDSAAGTVVADAFRIIYRGPVLSVHKTKQPTEFVLYQNYPNPFNPTTTIKFRLNRPSNVILTVYNSIGQRITVLVDKYLQAGFHQVLFNADNLGNLASGV